MASRNYSNITFDSIRSELQSILKAKGGSAADFSENSYGRIILELFAGTADMMSYYAESGFNNSFLETATSAPAIYAGARMLGYSPSRPVPAKAGFAIQTTETGIYDTIRVFIPRGTKFSVGTSTLTALDDIEFAYDRNTDTRKTGQMTLVSGRAVLAEGVFKRETLVSNGTQNQTFHINDYTFSDYFGDADPNYVDDGRYGGRINLFTTITTDATMVDHADEKEVVADRLYWRISRRGFIDPSKVNSINDIDQFLSGSGTYSDNYTAIINTSNDGAVEIKFGDGLKSAIPFGMIEVNYFSTTGEYGNRLNVSGMVLSTSSTGIVITQADGSASDITLDKLNIALVTDIRGGQNMESITSIKNNASAIFNTLDRLVTRMSYRLFLGRYAGVKYATAYGEDVLNTKLTGGAFDVKYMNQIRFSALKELYSEKDGSYYPTSADEYLLDGYKVNGLMYNWLYDIQASATPDEAYSETRDVIVKRIVTKLKRDYSDGTLKVDGCEFADEESINRFCATYLTDLLPAIPQTERVFDARLTPMDFVEDGSELESIMYSLNQRGMVTVGGGYHNYVYPSVHPLCVKMDVTMYNGQNFTDIRDRIKTLLYAYIRDNVDFATPIYRSKLEALVHTMVEVAGVDVYFEPIADGFEGLDLLNLPWLGGKTDEYIPRGTVSMSEFDYTVGFDVYNGVSLSGKTETFTIGNQSDIQTDILNYYKSEIAPAISDSTISDKDIDRFTAFIWDCVMQKIYKSMRNAVVTARGSGDFVTASVLYGLVTAVKGWDMGVSTLTFKDCGNIRNMAEINGTTLYDYMRYGMEYIKLVRNVLSYYVCGNLIDENGNVTRYSNGNEIVQLIIPTEGISLGLVPTGVTSIETV